MPLFKCEGCGCIENTALGHYWDAWIGDGKLGNGKHLCSECGDGTWHGRFPKRTPEEAGYVQLKSGFWGLPEWENH